MESPIKLRFPMEEINYCENLFKMHYSTSQVQEYLMKKYNVSRAKTSNFVRLVRKELGIYSPRTSKPIYPSARW